MQQDQNKNVYESESADKTVGDLFSGRLSLSQALQKLRTRLLDLSSRNRLLNYKHPKGRSIQFVDNPNLNLIFNRLLDGKSLLIKYVPEPDLLSYEDKRPDVKTFAQACGMDIDFEFPQTSCSSSANKHTPKLQALYYPADLDKLCRKIGSEARTVIEETGTNMLYLVFGFLEFYEREDSERPLIAPLLSVPVVMEKGSVDPDTRTYRYSITYSGEDVHENQTLREKLSRDFLLQLQAFDEEDDPGTYFQKIQQAIQKRKRWKVRYQLTLGFFSFGKLAIWRDLDPNNWPGLLDHILLKKLFSGGSGGAGLFPEDYEIDKHPQGDLPLIYDADSSQHSAIIDVLSGKNMVINGPPGTGKSQTITNIIAVGLRAGKKILFVSEKLAALEVVRHRLNLANLGHFCLELHSHKTQKKKLLSDLQERMEEHFRPPQQLQDKISTLNRHKKELNRYAQLMASRVGNELGLTIHELFWRAEWRRQAIGDMAGTVQSLFLADAINWSYDDIEEKRARLEALGQLYTAIGCFDSSHHWWGFTPQPLAPGDDEVIGRIVSEAAALATQLFEAVSDYRNKTGDSTEPPLAVLELLNGAIQALPLPPDNIETELLPRVFTVEDPKDKRELLTEVIGKVKRARELNAKANTFLIRDCGLSYSSIESDISLYRKKLTAAAFSVPVDSLVESVEAARQKLYRFKSVISGARYAFEMICHRNLEGLDTTLKKLEPVVVENLPVHVICEGASRLGHEAILLGQSFERIIAIVNRRGIALDGSPESITRLSNPDGIEEILAGLTVDDSVIAKARQAAAHFLAELPISELNRRQRELHSLHARIDRALGEIEGYARQADIPFDASQEAIARVNVLARIASKAPTELLHYRYASLANPKTPDLLTVAEKAYSLEQSQRKALAVDFYLDTLPNLDELKAAIRTFRQGDGLFNFLKSDWRLAKKLFRSICKTKANRKAADCEAQLSCIVDWIVNRATFVASEEFKDAFGPLFKGLATDFAKIHRLHAWYVESHAEMSNLPGLIEEVDLSLWDYRKVQQLAAWHSRLQLLCAELDDCRQEIQRLLDPMASQLETILRQGGWTAYKENVLSNLKNIEELTLFLGRYLKPGVSPKRGLEALNAKLELLSAKDDFKALSRGIEVIREGVDTLLHGVASIPCASWGEYLVRLTDLAHTMSDLGEMLAKYGERDSTPRGIRTFFEAKLALDSSLETFATFSGHSPRDWESYCEFVSVKIDTATKLSGLLKPIGRTGATCNEVIGALRDRSESLALIHGLSKDAEITSMLQGFFQGISTDLESLAATVSWGEEVKKTIRSASLSALILSPEAVNNFYWSRQKLQNIVDLREDIKGKLAELEKFGTFIWDDWNRAEGMPNTDTVHKKPGFARTAEEVLEYNKTRIMSKDDFASSLLARIEAASNDIDAILPWSKYNAERVNCKQTGLGDFVIRLEQKKFPPQSIGSVFEFTIYRSIGRNIYKNFPELEGFSGAKHEKKRSEFVTLDREIIGLTGKSFAYHIDKTKEIPAGNSGYRAADRTEMQLLLHEFGKQRRHLPIRQLIKRAGRAIQALKPCFMMGPMSVAQYLEQGVVEFDMVIMDEASQLRPEEALGAIARGKQLIVVGDPKQLPPTNFFDRLIDDPDESEDDSPALFAGSESILDICQQLFHPVRTLRWHYRSQHESLIAFSNHHFYNGKLVVFPSPFERNRKLGVRYRYITDGIYKDRQNFPEAQRVVDHVIEHMMKYPEESLGVVTLNQTQRDLIEDLLDKKLRTIEEAQRFISKWEAEDWPFFVKNLENVQGDERDVIFISTTFGRALGTDKVRQNFGPISRPDGWRRLNVLFTRARRKIELFTSMLPEDIVLEEKTPAGTRALRDYLDFAKRGVLTTSGISGREPDSDFEIAVGDMLRNHGYEVVPQLGVAGFFIDLAVRNPDRPGEFLAAVECDGAAYHSSNSARDRDRIREAILESLGWKDRIWRIWSTDWFYDPRRESERLLDFLQTRRKHVSSEPHPEYDEDIFEETIESELVTQTKEYEDSTDPALSFSAEELFVEVGDLVTYCFADKPDERHSVTIVATEGDPRQNLINENTPLAQALLNSAMGDESELELKGSPSKVIRIIKIQRQVL